MKPNPLPDYKTTSLMGPTGVARRTMPTQHILEPATKYTPWDRTDIRKTFKRFKEK